MSDEPEDPPPPVSAAAETEMFIQTRQDMMRTLAAACAKILDVPILSLSATFVEEGSGEHAGRMVGKTRFELLYTGDHSPESLEAGEKVVLGHAQYLSRILPEYAAGVIKSMREAAARERAAASTAALARDPMAQPPEGSRPS